MTGPATAVRPGPSVMRIAWVLVAGAFVSGVDASMANVALDRIGRDLHADLATTQWVTTGFLLAFAMSVPVSGWLSRRFGPGRLWLGGLAVFTVISGLCAASPGIGWLIGLRVAQGLAGGLLIPAGQTTIGEIAPPGELGRVMATVGIAVSTAPALGPVAGGLLLQAGSWRWLFLVNVPIGVAGLVAGLRVVPRRRPAAPAGPLDRRGLILASAGLPLLVLGVTDTGTERQLLGPGTVLPIVAGLALLAAFALSCRLRPRPLIDLRLLTRPTFAVAAMAATFSGALIFGTGLLFPLYLQLAEHRSTVGTGFRLLAQAGAMAAVSRPAGLLTDRYGPGPVAGVGAGLALAASAGFAVIGTGAPGVPVLVLLAVLGAGTALAGVAPTVAVYRSVPKEQLADATTMINVLQRVGGAVAGAVLAALVSRGLPDGTGHAFGMAFSALAAIGVLALLGALSLWRGLSRLRFADVSDV